jgi:hypothetical protein
MFLLPTLSYINYIHLCQYRNKIKYFNKHLLILENLSSPQILPKHPLQYQTLDTLLIQASKNIGTLMECGDGKKDGVQKLWLLNVQVEQEEPPMDIVIDFILQHSMLILWNNTLSLRFANSHYKVLSFK